jgi:hypothetical protein
MTTWTSDELTRIGAADELQVHPDGRRAPTTIWVVPLGDDLYIRAANGPGAAWYRAVQKSHEGHIRAGGVDKDVTFTGVTDDDVQARIDAVYRDKYRRYGAELVDTMVAEPAKAATLRLAPGRNTRPAS